ncbi:hypothetical protein QM027_05570 [Campylobacter concisus]
MLCLFGLEIYLEIIALAQSAKLESLKEFNKNEYINKNKSNKLKFIP